jgi:long-chain acyl-CoA synthetase
MQMPNTPEVFQAFQAIWRMGAIAVPINYQVGQEEINYIYSDCGVNTVITSPEYLDKVRIAQSKTSTVQTVILVGGEAPEGTRSFSDLVASHSDELRMANMADDDVACLIYTSGTTGVPKGVMLTHGGLAFSARAQQETTRLPQDLVTLAMLPLCHSFGVAMMNGSYLRLHGKVVIMRQFNLEQLFQNIQTHRVQSVPAVPTIYVYMLMYPDASKYDVSSVQLWICGSAPLSVDTWRQFRERFGGEIAEGWGLTEAGANNMTNAGRVIKVGSIGKPMIGMEARIVDDNDQEVPQGQEGEIVLKGPMVMKGYWNLPGQTAEAIRNGWLHTGDIGYVDAEGYYFITDRKKDLIIKGGENISPRMIEEVLYDYPKVAEAAAIGVKDPVYGEEIRGYVTLKPGLTATPEEIRQYCATKLKRFFVPREIVILDAFPKTLVGKILKKELRKMV